MKVLLVGSEVAPIIKLGGLGDVMGALPKALEKLGVNQDVIVPYFPIAQFTEKVYKAFDLYVPFDGNSSLVEVFKTKIPNSNVDVFLLKNDHYFGEGGVNAFANSVTETEMFSFFDRAVVEFIKSEFNTYDIVHCNDWHTGLITHLLNDELGNSRPKTLFTIHNLLYQGKAEQVLTKAVGFVPGMHTLIDWDVADGDINLMQQGLTSSDYISTVSPTYAKEILTEEHGREMSYILKAKESRLFGILNGIDNTILERNYDSATINEIKPRNKLRLFNHLGIKGDENLIVFGMVSRLDPYQKGLDIMYDNVSMLMKSNAILILLGKGDPLWEAKFKELESEFPGKLSVSIKFDDKLAKQIYSSSDFILAPSRYEPCGLIQMIGMWYGAIPIAHSVGGLKDSIVDGVDGLLFNNYDSDSFSDSLSKALNLYGTPIYKSMVETAMKKDFSWDRSAVEYKNLYEKMLL